MRSVECRGLVPCLCPVLTTCLLGSGQQATSAFARRGFGSSMWCRGWGGKPTCRQTQDSLQPRVAAGVPWAGGRWTGAAAGRGCLRVPGPMGHGAETPRGLRGVLLNWLGPGRGLCWILHQGEHRSKAGTAKQNSRKAITGNDRWAAQQKRKYRQAAQQQQKSPKHVS